MKKHILYLIVLMTAAVFAKDNLDITKKPEPLAEKKYTFPEYKQETLANGLKVFIVEDHRQPTINFNMIIQGGSSEDGEKPGLASMTASMLTKGAGKMNALQIASKLDNIGAGIHASADRDKISIGGSCLKKHFGTVVDMMSLVLLNPTFPNDELKKLKKLEIAGLQNEKSQPNAIMGKIVKKVIYGDSHPYAAISTEKSLNSIEHEDMVNYHAKYFVPGNASIVITGDITPKKAVSELEDALKKWKKSDVPEIKIPATKPLPLGVYFIPRLGSVQSTVVMAAPAVPFIDKDWEMIDMVSDVLGAGFGGKLTRSLREKYSYTYSPYSQVSRSKYANLMLCGADVRNAVTDSAIAVMRDDILSMSSELMKPEDLERTKKYTVGAYSMALASSDFIASLIQNADFNGIPIERVKNFPTNRMSISNYQVQKTAKKYLNPSGLYIFVVGSPDVRKTLDKFGKVYEYNLDIQPQEIAEMESLSITPEKLLSKYKEAIGGSEAIEGLKSIIKKGSAKLNLPGQDPLEGTLTMKQKSSGKFYQIVEMGSFTQESWVGDSGSWSKSMGSIHKDDGIELEKSNYKAELFPALSLIKLGYKLEVLGRQGGSIIMKSVSPLGQESTYFFDEKSYLLTKREAIENSPQGPIPLTTEFGDYQKFGNILMPVKVSETNPFFSINFNMSYELNPEIDDSIFNRAN